MKVHLIPNDDDGTVKAVPIQQMTDIQVGSLIACSGHLFDPHR